MIYYAGLEGSASKESTQRRESIGNEKKVEKTSKKFEKPLDKRKRVWYNNRAAVKSGEIKNLVLEN